MASSPSRPKRFLLRIGIGLGLVIAILLLWVSAGRMIGLWFDGFGTIEISERPVSVFAYEGPATGGNFRVGDVTLGMMAPDGRPFPAEILQGEPVLMLRKDKRTFPFGALLNPPPAAVYDFTPDAGDEVALTTRHGLSWPTPFDFNFMTGHSPSWKRHIYYRLRWRKPDGRKLRMVWRFEQYFYPGNGWSGGFMTHEGTTGLVRVDIDN